MLPYTSPDTDVTVTHIMSGGGGGTSSCNSTVTFVSAIALTTM